MVIYVIGSLRNPKIPELWKKIKAAGHEPFADWFGAGPEADDKWKEFNIEIGRDYLEALQSEGAKAIFEFDKRNLDKADACILVAPAGKSGHLELGYSIGRGKLGYYLLEANADRWDVMLQFARLVTYNLDDIVKDLNAQSIQQAPQEYPERSSLCGATNSMGQPFLPFDVVEEYKFSKYTGGSGTTLPGVCFSEPCVCRRSQEAPAG